MKIITIAAFSAQIMAVQAISITIDNNNLTDTNLVADEAGVLLDNASGLVSIGYFPGLSDSEIMDLGKTSVTNLLTSFTEVGAPVSFTATDGFFAGSATADLLGTDAGAVGNGLFIVIGNNTDMSLSDELLVFRYEDDFVAVPAEGPATANLIDGKGTLLIGGLGNYSFNTGGASLTSGFNLVAVPEPSSIALLGLGLVGFTLRRRR